MRPSPSALLLALGVALGSAGPCARAEDPKPAPSVSDTARKEAVERLEKDLRAMAGGPYAEKKREEIVKDLDALEALGGEDGVLAALEALAFDDDAVEQKVMAFAETVHTKGLVKPLAARLEHRDFRRRFRLHERIAHALAVVADVSALEPLTDLVGSESPRVVAAAADALAAFKSAPRAKRLEPVKRMLDRFESTWNLKESHRAEDRVAMDKARQDWEVYGTALRRALQALTGQTQLSHPRQFREWWNDHKKATDW